MGMGGGGWMGLPKSHLVIETLGILYEHWSES